MEEINQNIRIQLKENGFIDAYYKNSRKDDIDFNNSLLTLLTEEYINLVNYLRTNSNFDDRKLSNEIIEIIKFFIEGSIDGLGKDALKIAIIRLFRNIIFNNKLFDLICGYFFSVFNDSNTDIRKTKINKTFLKILFNEILIYTIKSLKEIDFTPIELFISAGIKNKYKLNVLAKKYLNSYISVVNFYSYYIYAFYLGNREEKYKFSKLIAEERRKYSTSIYSSNKNSESLKIKLTEFIDLFKATFSNVFNYESNETTVNFKNDELQYMDVALYWYLSIFLNKLIISFNDCRFMFESIKKADRSYVSSFLMNLNKKCFNDPNGLFNPNEILIDIADFSYNDANFSHFNNSRNLNEFKKFLNYVIIKENRIKQIKVETELYKKILMPNARESWILACEYEEKIIDGFVTLQYKKLFVSMLHNAVELLLKQRMIDIKDYRVIKFKNESENSASGQLARGFYLSEDLNKYFNDNHNSKGEFLSIEFNKFIDCHKQLFKDYYNKNPNDKGVITKSLKTLNSLRNEEMHFYVDEKNFLSEKEFEELVQFMQVFAKILEDNELLPSKNISTISCSIKPINVSLKKISYVDFLKNNDSVKKMAKYFNNNQTPLSINSYVIANYLKDKNIFVQENINCSYEEAISLLTSLINNNLIKSKNNKIAYKDDKLDTIDANKVIPSYLVFDV